MKCYQATKKFYKFRNRNNEKVAWKLENLRSKELEFCIFSQDEFGT